MGIDRVKWYKSFGNKLEDYVNKNIKCDEDIKNANWLKVKQLSDELSIMYEYIITFSKYAFDLPEDDCYIKILMKKNNIEKGFHDVEHLIRYLLEIKRINNGNK